MTASIATMPYDMAAGAEIDITWSTVQAQSEGGITSPRSQRMMPIRQFHLSVSPSDVAELRKLYLALLGPHWPIGVRDYSDYEFTDEELAFEQDTSSTYARLRKLYLPATGDRGFYQRILLPDQYEIPLTIKVDGSPLGSGSWHLDDFGIVVIPDTTLETGSTITASGQFLIPARFM